MKNGAENVIHRSITPLCITSWKHFTDIPASPQHPCQADKSSLSILQAEEEEQKKNWPLFVTEANYKQDFQNMVI